MPIPDSPRLAHFGGPIIARVGRIDRSKLGLTDFDVVGPARAKAVFDLFTVDHQN
jgi:hypothetical protein